MTDSIPPTAYTLHHLPAGSAEWAGLLPQYVLRLVATNTRQFATWASERLARASQRNEAVVALDDGRLRGFLLFEVADGVAELTFPWTVAPDTRLAHELIMAALQLVRTLYPDTHDIRAERQVLPDTGQPADMEAAGFTCHWRRRMMLELAGWSHEVKVPSGYRLAHWNIANLDAAAAVVFAANAGTLDAVLYAPFFGHNVMECRKGLLAVLAGRYGAINPRASLVAFHGDVLAGVNLVIGGEDDHASIIEISVAPAHQRHGLGRALMIHALRILAETGVERVELAVTCANTRAINLYDALGFSGCGDFPVCVLPVGA